MTEPFEEFPDAFEDRLGVYVGAASYDEVIAALRGIPAESELVVRIDNRASSRSQEGVRYRSGMPEYLRVEDDEGRRDVFVLYQHEQALGYGVMYEDAPFVLRLDPESQLDADRFSGGVRLRSPFGTVIDIAVWHPIRHFTETGDLAPGLGAFTVESFEPVDDEGER
jgi:hypothetical protein